MKKDFTAANWKEHLPIPVCAAYPEYTDFYYTAWESAHNHIRHIPDMPQTPYMDEAFCDTQVWIWDSCFMAQFCKFAQDVFPGVETLTNFYKVLHACGTLGKIVPSAQEPDWAGAIQGELNPIYIHIADNPPLFAWSEYENARLSGDTEHLKELLYEKQYLQKHYDWIESLRQPIKPAGIFNKTRLIAEDIGYRWEGGRSGMDNTPRGRLKLHDPRERPSEPTMLWLDALCQQALSAQSIAQLFALVEDMENQELWMAKYQEKANLVNQYYWDAQDQFYYDIDVHTHDFYRVMSIASYWTMTAGIAPKERATALLTRLTNEQDFGGDVPLISLARSDGDYERTGRYWRGGLWLPTAYAALRGLTKYGYHAEAHEAATKILRHMWTTYETYTPHTIWECYSPETFAPATDARNKNGARKDFCGWSALGPISLYIEYVLGFHTIDAFSHTVEWAKPADMDGEIGIRKLHFGDIVADIIADASVCRVHTNAPYTLIINDVSYAVAAGDNVFTL